MSISILGHTYQTISRFDSTAPMLSKSASTKCTQAARLEAEFYWTQVNFNTKTHAFLERLSCSC